MANFKKTHGKPVPFLRSKPVPLEERTLSQPRIPFTNLVRTTPLGGYIEGDMSGPPEPEVPPVVAEAEPEPPVAAPSQTFGTVKQDTVIPWVVVSKE